MRVVHQRNKGSLLCGTRSDRTRAQRAAALEKMHWQEGVVLNLPGGNCRRKGARCRGESGLFVASRSRDPSRVMGREYEGPVTKNHVVNRTRCVEVARGKDPLEREAVREDRDGV